MIDRFEIYRINSNHESQNILESRLLPLTHKINMSVRETALKEKLRSNQLTTIPQQNITPAEERIICLFLALTQCSFTSYFMVKRNG